MKNFVLKSLAFLWIMLYYFLEFLPKQIDFIQISLQLYLKPNISISIKNEEKSNILSI